MDLIRLKGVSKNYKSLRILQDVNLAIEEGDVLGVIGQSGSGKTTLLNLIAGFIEPTEGEIAFVSKVTGEEKNLGEHLPKIKRHIGYTPQHNSFYPRLTVKENLLHFGKLYGVNPELLRNNAVNLLKFTQLYNHKDKVAYYLSGGMQKRLDISCSLIHKPKLLILDEPTADLDPIMQQEILYLLSEVNKQGVTVVIASHHLDSIEQICNKVAIIHNGTVYSHGSIEEVKKPYIKDHFTIKVHHGQSKDELLAKLKTLPVKKIVDYGNHLLVYPENVDQTITQLIQIIKDDNLQLHHVDMRQPSLLEVFETITQNQSK